MRNDDLTWPEVFHFLVASWKLLSCAAISGLVFAFFSPRAARYEAIALLEMATTSNSQERDKRQLVEPVDYLSARLKNPMSYTGEALRACVDIGAESSVIFQPSWGSLAMLSVRHENGELAANCAKTLFLMIQKQQSVLAMPKLTALQNRLSQKREYFEKLGELIFGKLRSDKMQKQYLLVEYISLQREISDIEKELTIETPTRLLDSVLASQLPEARSRTVICILGFLGGLMLGVAVATVRRLYFNRK